MRLHGFLRDQHIIAGLGRRLANEICHRAQLSPFANTAKLDRDEVKRLAEAIQACIDEGLAYERGLDEMSSSADRPGHVHHRAGEPCPMCGDDDPVRRVHALHRRLLPDLPDRRQGPRRQHDQQVPQVARALPRPSSIRLVRSGRALDGVALLDELGGAGVDARPAEVVDLEALDDRVLAVLRR